MQFTLNAGDLIKKHGFNDAMIFLDVIDDAGFPDDLDPMQLVDTLTAMGGRVDQNDPSEPEGSTLYEIVLYKVIEQKLMPKLLGFTLVLDPLSSNSVRLMEGWRDDTLLVSEAIRGISAVIEASEVLSIAADVLTTYELGNGMGRSPR